MEAVSESAFTSSEIKSRIASSYDQIAPKYLEWSSPYKASSHNLVKEQIIPRLSSVPSPTVLELGCGAGIPTTKLLSEVPGVKITANDISPTQIALARQSVLAEKAEFIEGDMMAMEFPDQSFDSVLSMYSIMHLPREEQVTMIRRVAKWLKPGGLFLCSFPGEDVETTVEGDWLEKGAWMYWSSWGKEGSLRKVRECGLEIVLEKVFGDEGGGEDKAAKVKFLWVVAKKGGGNEA